MHVQFQAEQPEETIGEMEACR